MFDKLPHLTKVRIPKTEKKYQELKTYHDLKAFENSTALTYFCLNSQRPKKKDLS